MQPIPEPPVLMAGVYANEAPNFGSSLPVIPRATDTEFILKRAEDRFAAGKKAIQDGRIEEARSEFDKAIEILLNAPEDTAERPRLEKRLQEMIDAIYRYDAGEMGASEPPAEAASDGRPLDELLEMTFPVDPSLRNKVHEQIQATVSQLPLEESDAVISYINYFSSARGKQSLEAGLRRSGRYKPMIQRILAEEGLPQELIFLAQAESGFVPRAISNKACVGLWQFIKFRGEEYGLQVTAAIDERMDPEKATRAAAKHLHDLYAHLGDWYLAMAAYDCGPGCIDRAVPAHRVCRFLDPAAAECSAQGDHNYVPMILAMIIVSKNAKDYGLEDIEPDSPLVYDTVELEAPTSLALAAAAVDRPIAELKELNPALLKSTAPGGYQLHVPSGTRDATGAGLRGDPAGPAGFLAAASRGKRGHRRVAGQALRDHGGDDRLSESRRASGAGNRSRRFQWRMRATAFRRSARPRGVPWPRLSLHRARPPRPSGAPARSRQLHPWWRSGARPGSPTWPKRPGRPPARKPAAIHTPGA